MDSDQDELLLAGLLLPIRPKKSFDRGLDFDVGVGNELPLQLQRVPDFVDVLRHDFVPAQLSVDVVAHQSSLNKLTRLCLSKQGVILTQVPVSWLTQSPKVTVVRVHIPPIAHKSCYYK